MKTQLCVKRGRPPKDRRRLINVAATVDYRGMNDDRLYFLFRDPPFILLEAVFDTLVANGKGIAEKAIITTEHDIVRRMGKGYWRKAVEIVNPNFSFCSLDSMKLMVESRLRRIYPCRIHWMEIDEFLNV